jgi:hypothetical protein
MTVNVQHTEPTDRCFPSYTRSCGPHHGWSDVQVEIVTGGRHYLVENAQRKRSSSSSALGFVIGVCCLCE